MTRDEAIVLARNVRTLRPQQLWDDATPQAWAMMLDDVRMADAILAVKKLMTGSRYIDPTEIVAEVKRLRSARLDRAGVEIPPYPGDPDDVAAEIAWRRDWLHRIADGEAIRPPIELTAHAMPDLASVFRSAS